MQKGCVSYRLRRAFTMKIWKFELKKLWRRKLFLLLTLIAITCVALIFFRNYWAEDKVVEQTLYLIEPHNGSTTQTLNTYKEERLFREESDTLDEEFLAAYENVELMSERVYQWMADVTNKNWDRVPESEMAFIQTVLQHMEYGETYSGYSDEQLEQAIERNQILLENNLPFEDATYSITTPNFMKAVFSLFLSIPVLGLLVLLLGDVLVYHSYTCYTADNNMAAAFREIYGAIDCDCLYLDPNSCCLFCNPFLLWWTNGQFFISTACSV